MPVGASVRPLPARSGNAGTETCFRSTFDQVAVGIAHTTTEGRILEVNRRLCEMLGYTENELLALTTRDLTHPDDRDRQDDLRLELLAGKRNQFSGDKRYLRKDGGVFWVNRTVTLVQEAPGGEPYLIQTIDSINKRKLAEGQLARANRAHRVLAMCNHAQVHAKDEAGLLHEVCRVVVESGGYNQAWIGLPTGDPMRLVHPVAYAGYGSDEPMTASATFTPDGRYKGLAAEAFTSGETRIVRDILNDPQHERMRKRALQLGYQCSIALPLTGDGELLGVMVLHAAETDAFDADELTLLNDMAGDIAYGIASLRARAARAQAEQRSHENERRFRETFDQAAVGITRVDLDGILVDVNQKFCDMLGYTRDELLGKHVQDVTHPDDYGQGSGFRAKIIRGEITSTAGEKRFLRKDGAVIWARRTMSVARGVEGSPQYLISVVEDITERKMLELQFRDTFEQAAVGVFHADLNGHYLRVNRKFCEITGYTEEEMTGPSRPNLSHPGDYDSGNVERKRLLSGEIASHSNEKRYVRKDGKVIWVNRTESLARDASGKPLYFIRVIEDITERKQAGEMMVREHALLRTIIDALPDYIYVKDRTGPFLLANKAWLAARGEQDEDIAGKTVLDYFPREVAERLAAQDLGIVKTGIPLLDVEQKLIVKSRDGGQSEERWASTTKVPMRTATGDIIGTVGISRDITEQKQSVARRAMEHAVTRMLAESSALAEAMPKILRIMCEAMGWAYGARWAWNEKEQRLCRAEYWCEIEPEFDPVDREYWLRVADTGAGRLLRRAWIDKKATWLSNLHDDKSFRRRASAIKLGWHSAYAFPIQIGSDIVGVMEFFGLDKRQPDDAMLQVTGSIGIQIGQFIQRKDAEQSLRKSEETLRATFNYAPIGIMHTSIDNDRVLHANSKLREMLGYTQDELLGMTTDQILHPDYRGKDRDKYREKMLKGEMRSFSSERALVRKDGSTMWANRIISLVRDAAGTPQYFIRIIEDTTERTLSARHRAMEHAVTQVLAESVTEDEAMPGILQTICQGLGWTCGAHWKWDETAELLRCAETWHVDAVGLVEFVAATRERPNEAPAWHGAAPGTSTGGIVRRVWFSGAPAWVTDLTRQPDFRRGPIAAKAGLRSAFGFPILAGAQPLGVMEFYSRDMREPDEALLQIVRAIGSQIGQFIQRKEAERALRTSEERYRDLFELSPLPMWVWDDETRAFMAVNEAAVKHYGYTREEFLGMKVQDIWAPGDETQYEESLRDRTREQTLHLQRKHCTKDGRVIDVDVTARRFMISGRPVWLTLVNDITDRKRAEEQLLHLAHYDVLTNLPNRVLFYDRLKQALAQSKRNQWITAVMFMDVDRFKNVNDTLGHSVGDLLLQQVSERLVSSVRSEDTVGRLGGDEFVIVLSHLSSAQDASLVAQKIMANFHKPFRLEGAEIYVTASIGITLYPEDSTEQDALIKNADAAMYKAKEAGRNSFQFYTPEMNARGLALLNLEGSLRRALERDEFLLHYQPKANIASGEITGFEALLRWNHPERGLVLPAEFIPVLEETGLIVPAGAWVLNAACLQIKQWEHAGVKQMPVAVNLSARQFLMRALGPTIKGILDERRVDPQLLELEITESSLMVNPEEAARTLEYLKSLGVKLSIDDFGTGYSSLSYLKRFPLDALKVDGSFVRDVTTNPDDANITRAVISMAHSLGLKVIAEGVETEPQLAFLAEYGCNEIQGYYFAQPMPAEECTAWLTQGRSLKRLTQLAEPGAPTVLLVDDNDDDLLLLKRTLSRDGYRIFSAHNASEAIEALNGHRVDLVITDQNMAGMSGLEFLSHIKRAYPNTLRIMISAQTDFKTVADAVNKGEILKFLSKARSPAQLRADVWEALQARASSPARHGVIPGTAGK